MRRRSSSPPPAGSPSSKASFKGALRCASERIWRVTSSSSEKTTEPVEDRTPPYCYRLLPRRRNCLSDRDAVGQNFRAVLAAEYRFVLRASGHAAAAMVDLHRRDPPRPYARRARRRHADPAIDRGLRDELPGCDGQCICGATPDGRAPLVRHHPQDNHLRSDHCFPEPGLLRARRRLVQILGGGSLEDYGLFWARWYAANALGSLTLGPIAMMAPKSERGLALHRPSGNLSRQPSLQRFWSRPVSSPLKICRRLQPALPSPLSISSPADHHLGRCSLWRRRRERRYFRDQRRADMAHLTGPACSTSEQYAESVNNKNYVLLRSGMATKEWPTARHPPASSRRSRRRASGSATAKPAIFTVSCTTFTHADVSRPPALK